MFKVKWVKLFQPIYFEGQLLNNVIRKSNANSLSHEQVIFSLEYDNQLNMFIINNKLYIPITNICAFEIEEIAELKDSSTQKNKLITNNTINSSGEQITKKTINEAFKKTHK